MEEAIFPEAHSQALYTYLHQNWFYLYLFYLKNFSHSGIFDALATTFTSFLPCLIYSQSLSFQNVSYSFLESLQMGYPLSGKLSPASLQRNLRTSQISAYRLPPPDRSSFTALSSSYLSPVFSIPTTSYYPMTLIDLCYHSLFKFGLHFPMCSLLSVLRPTPYLAQSSCLIYFGQ